MKIVVTLHGIRTRGEWQKKVTPYLARYGIIPYHLDYGWFGVLSFILPWVRKSRVQWFRNELHDLLDRTGTKKVSIIAHSFGTYLVTEALEAENGNFRYDRVVLTGSIVRREFPWESLIKKRWVLSVRNEIASGDKVVKLAELFAKLAGPLSFKAGATGVHGFSNCPAEVLEYKVGGGHSQVLNIGNYEKWARFIAYPRLPDDHLTVIRTLLQQLRQLAADGLGVSSTLVRTNVFVPTAGQLRMVPEAWDNMTYAPEHSIELEIDHGCTGRAFTDRTPFSIRRKGDSWTAGVLPNSQQAKVNPRLQWVLSLPLGQLVDEAGCTVAKDVVGVVNIDGLDIVPQMLQTPRGDPALEALIFALWASVGKVRNHLVQAYIGEPLHDD